MGRPWGLELWKQPASLHEGLTHARVPFGAAQLPGLTLSGHQPSWAGPAAISHPPREAWHLGHMPHKDSTQDSCCVLVLAWVLHMGLGGRGCRQPIFLMRRLRCRETSALCPAHQLQSRGQDAGVELSASLGALWPGERIPLVLQTRLRASLCPWPPAVSLLFSGRVMQLYPLGAAHPGWQVAASSGMHRAALGPRGPARGS